MITFNPTTLSLDFVNNVGVINGEDYSLDPARTSGRINAITNGNLNFTRASAGTFVGSNGLVQAASTNTPRFDYSPTTLQPNGLLIEEQRTNIVARSTWPGTPTTSSAIVTQDAALSPDGTSSALSFVATTDITGTHRVVFGGTHTAVVGTTYTVSVYVKSAGIRYVSIACGNGVMVDLQDGVFIVPAIYAGASVYTDPPYKAISNKGNGWYRIEFTYTAAGSFSQITCFLSQSPTSTTFAGDGVSGIHMWGFQAEAGSFATSYIPTSGSTVTRSADVCTMTGTNFSSWYKQNAGTFLASIIPTFVDSNITPQFTVLDILFNTTNYLQLFCSTVGTRTGTPNFRIRNNILVSNELSSLSFVSGQIAKIAGAFSVSDITTAMNGSVATSTTVTLGTMPTPTSASFGNSSTITSSINGHLRSVQFYPTRLPDSVLQSLTA